MNRSAIVTFALALGLFVPAVAAMSAAPAEAAVRIELGAPIIVIGGHAPAPARVERVERVEYVRESAYQRACREAELRHVEAERHAAYGRHIAYERHERHEIRDARYEAARYQPVQVQYVPVHHHR